MTSIYMFTCVEMLWLWALMTSLVFFLMHISPLDFILKKTKGKKKQTNKQRGNFEKSSLHYLPTLHARARCVLLSSILILCGTLIRIIFNSKFYFLDLSMHWGKFPQFCKLEKKKIKRKEKWFRICNFWSTHEISRFVQLCHI